MADDSMSRHLIGIRAMYIDNKRRGVKNNVSLKQFYWQPPPTRRSAFSLAWRATKFAVRVTWTGLQKVPRSRQWHKLSEMAATLQYQVPMRRKKSEIHSDIRVVIMQRISLSFHPEALF